MKSILLAAAALVATPAVAQMQPSGTADQTTPSTTMQGNGAASPTTDLTTRAPTTGAATGGSMSSSGATTPSASGTMVDGASAGDPPGGYMPASAALQGTPAPGAIVRFQKAPDPSVAFPPPAPMQDYPVCKKGQYDNCIQRGGK